jgi:hypothetical protein
MGRGRAKAKQTKVARALKYGGPQTDFDRLQAELGSPGSGAAVAEVVEEDDLEEDPYADDPYAKYYDEDSADEDDDATDTGGSR